MPEATQEVSPEKQVTPVTPPSPQYVSARVMYQAVVIVSLAMSALSVAIYDRFFTTKFAAFDLPGLLVTIQAGRANGSMTEEQAVKKLDEVESMINSLPKNYVVLSGDTILGKPTHIRKLSISTDQSKQ